jgi:UDP-glucose 4-epimerase
MKVGVIGANGFVGRSLCSKYLIENNTVFAFFHKKTSLIPKGCILIPIDSSFNEKMDCIVIAIGGHAYNHEQYLDQYLLIKKIITTFKFVKIIFISSVEVYGRNENRISINSCFNKPNMYGLSKICQEFLIKSVENYTIIRPTYIYGDGMNENSLLPIWINKAKNKEEIVIYGDGKRKQDYLHIEDLTQLCWLSTIKKNKNITVIAATGNSISNMDLAISISNKFSGSTIKYYGEDNTESSLFDVEFTKNKYDWIPEYSLLDWLK